MKVKLFNVFISAYIWVIPVLGIAQGIAINTDGSTPDSSAALDVSTPNKGVLIPRVALDSITDSITIPRPEQSLLVWNTNELVKYGSGTGFYYNSGDKDSPYWVKIANTSDFSSSNNAWELEGNSGTDDNNNFIGTIDGQALAVRTNNIEHLRVDTLGNVGIGTATPVARLHVADSSVVFTASDLNLPGTPNDPPVSGTGRRMMWYPDKAAFRAGGVFLDEWDKDSIGDYSFASGYRTKASGNYSASLGGLNNSKGNHSFSAGLSNSALGAYSSALGHTNISKENFSFAAGYSNLANSEGSVALGRLNTTDGWASVAIGHQNYTLGYSSVALGYTDTASGDYSTAIGYTNKASSNYAVAIGYNNKASNLASVALGFNNISSGNQSMAFGSNNVASGVYSTVWGSNSVASGNYSTAWGRATSASGIYSTVWGSNSVASGGFGTAWGVATSASGAYSTVWGSNSVASGNYSTAWGIFNKARSYGETVIGLYNDTSDIPGNTATSRLFQIGNGTADNARRNAVTVLRDGRVGIGTVSPQSMLHVAGKVRIVDGTQANNYYLASDASGVASWKPVRIDNVKGIKGAGYTFHINTGTNWYYTGSRITLPTGTWAVNVYMLMAPDVISPNNSFGWVRSTFSDVNNGVGMAPSNDIIGSAYISGNVPGTTIYAMVTGSIIINNNSGGSKTYYYIAGNTDYYNTGTGYNLNRFGGGWNEDNIIAYKIEN